MFWNRIREMINFIEDLQFPQKIEIFLLENSKGFNLDLIEIVIFNESLQNESYSDVSGFYFKKILSGTLNKSQGTQTVLQT
jgi:hypothetical protein